MDELVDRFCSVTGSTENIATQFLQMADGDIDHAITFYFDSDQSEQIIDLDSQTSNVFDESRTPIPQKHERLIDPELPPNFTVRRRQSLDRGAFSIDPQNTASTSVGNSNQNGSGSSLEKMFEPPVDILFNGTFEEAKDYARIKKLWLLVSVHNNEIFDCHRLNRDLWKNKKVKALIKRNFVFWQVLFSKAEAQQFVQWYRYDRDSANVAVIDPLTGECKLRLNGAQLVDTSETLSQLQEFVRSTSGVGGVGGRKRSMEEDTIMEDVVDLTAEEGTPEEAIPRMKRMRLLQSPPAEDIDRQERWYDHLGREDDQVFCVLLRLPSGLRDTVALPASSRLRALLLYVAERGCEMGKYELVRCFPRRVFGEEAGHLSLLDCGIGNRDTLHVQERM